MWHIQHSPSNDRRRDFVFIGKVECNSFPIVCGLNLENSLSKMRLLKRNSSDSAYRDLTNTVLTKWGRIALPCFIMLISNISSSILNTSQCNRIRKELSSVTFFPKLSIPKYIRQTQIERYKMCEQYFSKLLSFKKKRRQKLSQIRGAWVMRTECSIMPWIISEQKKVIMWKRQWKAKRPGVIT